MPEMSATLEDWRSKQFAGLDSLRSGRSANVSALNGFSLGFCSFRNLKILLSRADFALVI